METIGKRLQRFRVERRLSQTDLAKLTNIEQSTVSRIESGTIELLSPHAQVLADALHVTLHDLLCLKPIHNPNASRDLFVREVAEASQAYLDAVKRLAELGVGLS